ncbi:family 20 glycosylhydrolase [Paenibacillus elgii]|nr:family 20 glycosylhydrolase [Paenibacillus elgii]
MHKEENMKRKTLSSLLSLVLLSTLVPAGLPQAAAEAGRTGDVSPTLPVTRSVYETVYGGRAMPANVVSTPVGVNLAVHQAVYASGNEVDWLGPANAVDGNGSTRWSSALQDDQWFYVDLGEEFTINRVTIKWQTPASKYKLLVSSDAQHWTNVLGNDGEIACRGGTESTDFDDVKARYVKFQGVQRAPVEGTLYGYSFFEFEVYNAGELPKIVKGITQIPPIAKGQTEIVLPQVPEGYKVSVYGSDRLPVIDQAGKIHTPLVDTKVNLLFQVEHTGTGQKAVTGNVLAAVPGQYTQTDDLNKEPKVIPSLREWYGRTGNFTLKPTSRIVVNPAHKTTLKKAAEQTKEDLRDITGINASIIYGAPQAGDLYLSIDDSLAWLGKEGYLFDVNDYVAITSADVTGVFFGTRSALQILKQDEAHTLIPKGTARDYPKYETRGLMIDVARKFYTIEFLRDYVKLLSWYKMNQFQIHLNDDVGTPFQDGTTAAYRLESTKYPGLASKNGFYTKEEFRDLQRLGMDYGVNVIPEIDTPGHSRAFTSFDPSLGTGPHLDITKPKTVDFVKSLLDEYIDGDNPTFIGPDVHVGTDEYWGNTEVFRGYMDTLVKHINGKGKHPHIWGGMKEYNGVTPVSTEATMDVWHVPYGDARQAIDLGYDILNTENSYMYLVPRLYKDRIDPKYMYNMWEPNVFSDTTLPYGHPKLKGAMLALWNDISDSVGLSMDDSHDRLFPGVQVLSEKMWTGSREDGDYNAYAAAAERIGEAPNANISHKLQVPNKDSNVIKYSFENGFADASGNGYNGIGKSVAAANGKYGNGVRFGGGESYIKTPLEALGFGWTVSMWIKPDADNPDDAVLLESPVGQVKLKEGKTGLLGFSKEHYHSTFQYKVPAEQWTHLLLTGDNKGVSLYVNGNEYVEKLWVTNGASPQIDTLVLPLEKIGSSTNSFKGVIDNLIVYNKAVSFDGMNLALNKHAEASTSEAPHLSPDQAVDGNTGTRWSSSFADDNWFSVDLGEQQELDSVVIKWEGAYAKKYKILVSGDGQQWQNVKAGDAVIDGKGGVETIKFDTVVKARYVKLQGIERATIYGYSILEFEVYGPGVLNSYLELVKQAEGLLALGKGDSGLRSQLQEMLNQFPYDYESSISPLQELIARLKESIEWENDKTPPVTTASVSPSRPDGQHGWFVHPVTVTLSAQDEQSGVARTEYSLDLGKNWILYVEPIQFSTDGMYGLRYRSTDKAGNVEKAKPLLLKVDTTAPTLAATANGVPLADGIEFTDSETLVLDVQASDPVSGIAGTTITVDGKPYAPGTPLRLAGQLGTHAVQITATDQAGNVSQAVISMVVKTNIASMQRLLESYHAAGELSGPLKNNLSASLKTAQKHENKGKLKQAARAMNDFKKKIDKATKKDVISEAAKAALIADANALIQAWTGNSYDLDSTDSTDDQLEVGDDSPDSEDVAA